MADEKKNLPETVRYPSAKRASDEQPDANVAPEHRPVHHVTVADCYPTILRREALFPGSVLFAHRHGSMTFHAAGDTHVGLLDSFVLQRVPEKELKEKDQNNNHDRAADELSCGKLP